MRASLCQIIALQISLAASALAGLGDGLAAYYSFEANVQDQSGNGRHLTAIGTPEAGWAGGTVTRAGSSIARNTLLAGNALNLVDADGDYLKAPFGSGASATAAGSFNLGGNFTISAWHYLAPLPSNTSTRYFVFEGEANFDVSWGTSSGDTYLSYNAQTAAHTTLLSRHAWHHVVHVFETVGDDILLTTYVDGLRLGQNSADVAAMDFGRLVLGNSRDGQDRKWDGLLDEVAVWNRALSAAEMDELHARGFNGFGVTEDLGASGAAYLRLTAAQPMLGSVVGSGIYDVGEQITITAQPAPGYVFASWSGGFAGQPRSFTHTVAQSITAAASFIRDDADSDGDGLSNYDEVVVHGTNPSLADTDADGIPDCVEIEITRTSPTQSDAALVNQAIAAFSPAATGIIALDGLAISADTDTGKVVLTLGLAGYGGGAAWESLAITPASLALLPAGDLKLALPAPSGGAKIFAIQGKVF